MAEAATIAAVASLVTAVVGAGTSAYQGVEASNQKDEAKKAAAGQKVQQDKLLQDAKDKEFLSEQQKIRDQQRYRQKAAGAAFEGRQGTLLTGSSPNAAQAFGGKTLLGG